MALKSKKIISHRDYFRSLDLCGRLYASKLNDVRPMVLFDMMFYDTNK